MDRDISPRYKHAPADQPGMSPKPPHIVTDLRQVQPKPAAPAHPKPHYPQHHQPPRAHAPHPQPPAQHLSHALRAYEQPENQPQIKKQKSGNSRLSPIITGVLVVILIGLAVIAVGIHHRDKKEFTVKSAQTVAPYQQPSFPVYFPANLPSGGGISVDKKLIAYYKDVFSFILEQDGKKAYFVDENAAKFGSLSDLKVQLSSVKNFTSKLGPGVTGGFGQGAITAIQTKDNTIIKVSCSAPGCGLISKTIIDSMQGVDDPASLK